MGDAKAGSNVAVVSPRSHAAGDSRHRVIAREADAGAAARYAAALAMRSHRLLVFGLAAASAAAQTCLRPTPPLGGFPTTVDLLVPVTYSDGYQTFASLIRPDGTPPTCGWPMVVFVHPFGQSRGFDLAFQMELAGQGYAVWSYDVRAHGQAVLPNVGHAHAGSTLMGPIERYDLAEQILFVGSQPAWAGIVDATRVAVLGSSGGGAHAWQAAAWSGQLMQAPGRPGVTFPAIACVVAADLGADAIDDWLRGGQMWTSWFVEAISGVYTGVAFDQTFLQTCRNAFLAQDPAALAAAWVAEERGVGNWLTTSPVPVLHSHAFFDSVMSPLMAIARGEARTAPHRVWLSTLGHGVPANTIEFGLRQATIVRWLHRFLWSVPNEVELEARAVLAEVPLTQAERDDPAHQWSHLHLGALTTPPSSLRLYLHDDAALRAVPPATPQADAVIAQVVDPLATDFTAADYLATPSLRTAASVLARCPLQERVWTFIVTEDSQVARSPTVHLRLVPQGAQWQLGAVLSVTPAGSSEEVMLGANALASNSSVPGMAEDHDLRLPPVAAAVPAGSTLRLRLRNLWLRESPMAPALDVAPLFHDFEIDVVHGAPVGSWLDLPIEPAKPSLVVDHPIIDLLAPGSVVATVRGGSVRSGFPFFAMVGLSGQAPATGYLNAVIPIDADWLVLTSAGSSEPPLFSGFLGFLDGAGRANVTFNLSSVAPLPAVLNGLAFTFAAFVWDGPWAATGAASIPCDVLMR